MRAFCCRGLASMKQHVRVPFPFPSFQLQSQSSLQFEFQARCYVSVIQSHPLGGGPRPSGPIRTARLPARVFLNLRHGQCSEMTTKNPSWIALTLKIAAATRTRRCPAPVATLKLVV